MQSLFSFIATSSFCWFLASSLWMFPHSLSYFNEAIGGPRNGTRHLLGSNVDWGQDLLYLDAALDRLPFGPKPECRSLYFGPATTGAFGIHSEDAWLQQFRSGANSAENSIVVCKGVYAVSSNFLNGCSCGVLRSIKSTAVRDEEFTTMIQRLEKDADIYPVAYTMQLFNLESTVILVKSAKH